MNNESWIFFPPNYISCMFRNHKTRTRQDVSKKHTKP